MDMGRSYLSTVIAHVQNTSWLEGAGGDNRWWKFYRTFTVTGVTQQLSNTGMLLSQKRLSVSKGWEICGQMSIKKKKKNHIQFSTVDFFCLGVSTSSAESRFSSHLSDCCSCRIPKGFKDQNVTRSCERGNRLLIHFLSPAWLPATTLHTNRCIRLQR